LILALFCEPHVTNLLLSYFYQILDKKALQDLVKEIDPSEQLDEDVEEVGENWDVFVIQLFN
jgi:hypothetical protein